MSTVRTRRVSVVLCALAFVVGGGPSGCSDPCAEYRDVVEGCYDAYCAGPDGAGSRFCGCWGQSQDLDLFGCTCQGIDWDLVCARVEETATNPADFDCAASITILENSCLGP